MGLDVTNVGMHFHLKKNPLYSFVLYANTVPRQLEVNVQLIIWELVILESNHRLNLPGNCLCLKILNIAGSQTGGTSTYLSPEPPQRLGTCAKKSLELSSH